MKRYSRLDALRKAGGSYELDEVEYETAVDVLHQGVLEFCGCGAPRDNLAWIADGLRIVLDYGSPALPYEQWKKKALDWAGNEDSLQFFFYWADSMGLTEHGGCIPGWLDAPGKGLLADIEQALKETADDKD